MKLLLKRGFLPTRRREFKSESESQVTVAFESRSTPSERQRRFDVWQYFYLVGVSGNEEKDILQGPRSGWAFPRIGDTPLFCPYTVLFGSVMVLVAVLFSVEMYFNEGIMRREAAWK